MARCTKRTTRQQFGHRREGPSGSKSFIPETYVNVFLLRIIGLMTFKNQNLNSTPTRILSVWYHLLYWFFGSILISTFVKNYFNSYYNIQLISEMVIVFSNYWRFIILYTHRVELAALLGFAEKLWHNLQVFERETVIRFLNKGRIVTYVYLSVCFLMCMSYTFFSQSILRNSNDNYTVTKLLPFEFYVDVQTSPWFEIVLILQFITMFALAFTTNGVDTVGLFFIMMACGYTRILCYRIQKISAHNSIRTKEIRIKHFTKNILMCIKYHQIVLEYCYQVQNFMSQIFVTQLLGSTYTMSLVGIKLVGDDPKKYKYILVLVVLLIQFLYLHWAPDKLTHESQAIANLLYFMPSFGYKNRQVSKLLYMFLMSSQHPVELRAAGYFKLSMESFRLLISNVVSLFIVFRRFN